MKTVTFDETKWQLVPKELSNRMLGVSIASYTIPEAVAYLTETAVREWSELLAAAPEHPEVEADQFWEYDNPEETFADCPQDIADNIAQNLCAGEDATVRVMRSKKLPDREMRVTATCEIDGENHVVWGWADEDNSLVEGKK